MSMVDLLDELSELGVELWLEDDRLCYTGPGNVLTSEKLSVIRRHKAEIISLFKEKNYSFRTYPLSHGQRGLWFLYKTAPDSAAYNGAFTARILSDVDVGSLRRAFQKLVARHPSLRSTFGMEKEELVQHVHGHQEVVLHETDACGCTPDELKEQVVKAYREPFDLEDGPVFRVHLFHVSDQEHVLLLSFHHIICDGWSLWILVDELRQTYIAETTGESLSLPSIEYSYCDFVQWQSELLSGPRGEELKNFWLKRLDGELPILNLPIDKPRPSVHAFNGATHAFELPSELANGLKSLAKERCVTLYTLMLAAFQVFLHRYTSQEEILVGSPVAGRSRAKFAPVVGHFVNLVVHRCYISDNPNFLEFVERTGRGALDAITYQDYPFDLLVEELKADRDPSISPVFQAMFVLQKPHVKSNLMGLITGGANGAPVRWGDLALAPFPMAQQEGQFDLTLDMIESSETIHGAFNYNRDIFDESTIGRIVSNFQTLLNGIVAGPNRCVSDLPILDGMQLQKILLEWNDTPADYPSDKCIHELFEAMVDSAPECVALVYRGKSLTYGELNARANQVGRALKSLGVSKDRVVGLLAGPSLERVIAMLAVLKAGGAYLPIATESPRQRKRFMLEDSGAIAVLTLDELYQANRDALGAMSPDSILFLDSAEFSSKSDENQKSRTKPGDLAYIMYTSGTTGNPKGVMVEHRNVVNVLSWFGRTYGLGRGKNVLQLTDYSFDPSVEQIFGSLIHGATVYIPDRELFGDYDELCGFIQNNRINVVNFVPDILGEMLGSRKKIETIETVISGGEQLRESIKNKILQQGYNLFNHYGPTETTVEVLAGRCIPGPVSLGRPIANTRCYIFDPGGNVSPIGVPGELNIAGVGVVRGYLNNPELTRERFTENENARGEWLYRTGDLARWLPDGTIAYVGRCDNQIKIRGHRIEPAEIESRLLERSDIDAALVTVKQAPDGGGYLCAYVAGAAVPPESDMRDYLAGFLPDYMMPARFVALDKMPLLANKKIDLRALPEPGLRVQADAGPVAPRNDIETALLGIWKSTLDQDGLGVEDNFYAMGGNSLVLLSLHRKIMEDFQVNLTLRDLVEHPTVSSLARFLKRSKTHIQKQSQRSEQLSNFFKGLENRESVEEIALSTSKASLNRSAMNSTFFNRAYEDGAKVAFCTNVMATEVLFAMDLLPFNVEMISGFLNHAGFSPKFLNAAEQNGFVRDLCSVSRCVLGAAYENCLPSPDLVAFTSYPCDSSSKLMYNLSNIYGKPWAFLDIPYYHDEGSIQYLAHQIEDMVDKLENILDRRMDMEKLTEAIEYSNHVADCLTKICELNREGPAPLPIKDAMDLAGSFYLLGSRELAEVCQLFLEEAKQRVAMAKDKGSNDKPRVLWHGMRPAYNDEILRYLETDCGFELISEVNVTSTNPYNFSRMEPRYPYRSLALRLIAMSASGPIDQFFNHESLGALGNHRIDGIISFNQWGCRHMLSVHQVARLALSRIGFPLLEIDGDYVDGRNYSFAPIKTRIDAFSEMLQERRI